MILQLLIVIAFSKEEHKLKFNEKGKFKIIQLTDLHLSDGDELDKSTLDVIRKLIDYEKPDFAAVTGDLVSGYNWNNTEGWYEKFYLQIAQTLNEKQTYWGMTPGNHDTEADLTSEQLSELDRQQLYSITKPNAENISHSFNYFLPVYDQYGENIEFRIWFLDSGDNTCLNTTGYDCVRPDQVDWFRRANSQIQDESKGKGILFVHIPIQEYMNLWNNGEFYGKNGETICCQALNTGLFTAVKEQPTVSWISVGHDHNNDWHGLFDGINLAFGRKTGYGQYGPKHLQHGARVFEITLEPFEIKTWIRQEDGSIEYDGSPKKRPFFSKPLTKCCKAMQKAFFAIEDFDVGMDYYAHMFRVHGFIDQI